MPNSSRRRVAPAEVCSRQRARCPGPPDRTRLGFPNRRPGPGRRDGIARHHESVQCDRSKRQRLRVRLDPRCDHRPDDDRKRQTIRRASGGRPAPPCGSARRRRQDWVFELRRLSIRGATHRLRQQQSPLRERRPSTCGAVEGPNGDTTANRGTLPAENDLW